MTKLNVDPGEINKFSSVAAHWWDTEGEFKTLHDINPLRVKFIQDKVKLMDQCVIDIGCGGGILTESLAQIGANVTGIDMSQPALEVANLHQLESGTQIEYIQTTAEQIAESRPEKYDIVTCLEMLEHVPNPKAIVQACSRLLKPGGHLFLSTINRNPKAYLFAIVGAEYLLKLLPQHTHDFAKFIKPSELAEWARLANLDLEEMIGIHYNLMNKTFTLNPDISVNYLVHLRKQN